uniref:NADH dehydrogenase [ubiquinone] 1 alpha subcomplex subunit 12 n=1 Tax=Oryza punctata TaxID=4537 RepID=A0A0E0LZB9_ORYPU
MAMIVRTIVKNILEKGLMNFIREGRKARIESVDARFVGSDRFGNKYYEKFKGTPYGTMRWVEYAKLEKLRFGRWRVEHVDNQSRAEEALKRRRRDWSSYQPWEPKDEQES